jgi:hypothetical protein
MSFTSDRYTETSIAMATPMTIKDLVHRLKLDGGVRVQIPNTVDYVVLDLHCIVHICDNTDYAPILQLSELIKSDKNCAILNIRHENEYIKKLVDIRLTNDN